MAILAGFSFLVGAVGIALAERQHQDDTHQHANNRTKMVQIGSKMTSIGVGDASLQDVSLQGVATEAPAVFASEAPIEADADASRRNYRFIHSFLAFVGLVLVIGATIAGMFSCFTRYLAVGKSSGPSVYHPTSPQPPHINHTTHLARYPPPPHHLLAQPDLQPFHPIQISLV